MIGSAALAWPANVSPGSKLTGLARVTARQIAPPWLPDLCNAANGEFVPRAAKAAAG